ncbi:MAG TPA: hypothetical protein DIT15_05600 [Arthrobacter bacterium]|nr:hypothetical protein [Arthrobacter sp.]HAP90076.1 hypothetical protein [Arthrobacter sp.]HBH58663.1 hypothetical protein [Arthrobacter sp.]HCB56638.1 hypothetical protein [Arthrobacter sp.]HCC39940.1 hypothetical protein [Arthrobacter sp.]
MNTGLSSRFFPGQRLREASGAGDEEVFETKASPPAVAGPFSSTASVRRRPPFRSLRSLA